MPNETPETIQAPHPMYRAQLIKAYGDVLLAVGLYEEDGVYNFWVTEFSARSSGSASLNEYLEAAQALRSFCSEYEGVSTGLESIFMKKADIGEIPAEHLNALGIEETEVDRNGFSIPGYVMSLNP